MALTMDGDELREKRMEMGWTQEYLADLLETNRGTLAHWECGRAPVPPRVARVVEQLHWRVMEAMDEVRREAV